MTFKPPDCPQCLNRGYYYVPRIIRDPYHDSRRAFNSSNYLFESTKEEVYCTCWHGQELQVTRDRMNHPEFENPFTDLSDEEIIELLSRESDRQKLIDSEWT
jgi:hypothetical protein